MPRLNIVVDAEVHRTSVQAAQLVDGVIAKYQPQFMLIIIGGSDADMDWRRFVLSDGNIARSKVPVDRYEKNLRTIAQKLIAAGIVPILTDIPNHYFEIKGPYVSKLAGKDLMPLIRAGGGQAESDKHLVLYRAVVSSVASELHIPVVRYGQALDDHDPAAVLCNDGTHPSATGHRVIADVLIPALREVCVPARMPGLISA
jgi:lysophospholipase L1-like esterase